jgi:dTDP-3-amino-3,4,6-trideoxy-alpha-D-glucose transaminase
VRLAHLEEWNRRRAAVARAYREGLAGLAGLDLPLAPADTDPAWHLFVVRHARRDQLRHHLEERGIETGLHYPIPPHRSPAFASGGACPDLPLTDALAASVLSLPMGPHLSAAGQERVIGAVRDFVDC